MIRECSVSSLEKGWKLGKLKQDFEHVRNMVEDHLSSINENSSEIQALFDYLQDLESKIEKVTARLDSLQLETNDPISQHVEPLNAIEKQVFLALYMQEFALNYQDIAERANLPIAIVYDSVASLVRKGVPIVRTLLNNQQFLQLATQFKERQAKENIINLSLESFF